MEVDIFRTNRKYNVIYADPPWKYGSKEMEKNTAIAKIVSGFI